jgi:CRP/FNR family cyclic AMP-dependent transcriptional regulator
LRIAPAGAGVSLYASGVPLSPANRLDLLRNVELFDGLDEKQLRGICEVVRTKKLKRKEELFHKGDEGRQVFIIMDGKLKALTTSVDGDDVVFSILGPGEVFGEIALLGGTQRTATVSAIEACELLVIDRRDFMAFLVTHPDISANLLQVLALRLKRVSELVEDTLFLNLPLRLAKKLNALSRLYGQAVEGGVRVDLKLSQEEWGDLVGATRESINKQVRSWVEQGMVRVDKGYIVILQPLELQRLAGAMVD